MRKLTNPHRPTSPLLIGARLEPVSVGTTTTLTCARCHRGLMAGGGQIIDDTVSKVIQLERVNRCRFSEHTHTHARPLPIALHSLVLRGSVSLLTYARFPFLAATRRSVFWENFGSTNVTPTRRSKQSRSSMKLSIKVQSLTYRTVGPTAVPPLHRDGNFPRLPPSKVYGRRSHSTQLYDPGTW